MNAHLLRCTLAGPLSPAHWQRLCAGAGATLLHTPALVLGRTWGGEISDAEHLNFEVAGEAGLELHLRRADPEFGAGLYTHREGDLAGELILGFAAVLAGLGPLQLRSTRTQAEWSAHWQGRFPKRPCPLPAPLPFAPHVLRDLDSADAAS